MKHCIGIVFFTTALSCAAQQTEISKQPDETDPKSPLHVGAIHLGVSVGTALGNAGGAFVNLPQTITFRIAGNGGASGNVYVGVALNANLLAVAEGAFLNGSRAIKDVGGGTIVETKTRALAYNAALHIRFRTRKSAILVPYVGVGFGTVQSKADVLVRFSGASAAQLPTDILVAATQVRVREAAFAPMLGAGLEIYSGRRPWFQRRLGFRIDGRGFLPTGSSHDPVGEITGGIFVVLH